MRTDLDRFEDSIDDFVVMLEGIRTRGGIREFFRHWPDSHKRKFIEQGRTYVALLSSFLEGGEADIDVMTLASMDRREVR
jgi:hypothetical protein